MAERSDAEECTTGESEMSRGRDKYCPHCQCIVPSTTFYRHKEQFYDEEKGSWSKTRLKKRKRNSTNTLRAAQPEYQGDLFTDTVESAVNDQAMDQEMHDFTLEGLFNCIRDALVDPLL